jgi:hypothetical protein
LSQVKGLECCERPPAFGVSKELTVKRFFLNFDVLLLAATFKKSALQCLLTPTEEDALVRVACKVQPSAIDW